MIARAEDITSPTDRTQERAGLAPSPTSRQEFLNEHLSDLTRNRSIADEARLQSQPEFRSLSANAQEMVSTIYSKLPESDRAELIQKLLSKTDPSGKLAIEQKFKICTL